MRQFTFDFPHRPAFGGADFLVAPSNAEAVGWIDRWPAWPSPAFVVCGPPGCGKSHLAQVWRARSAARELEAATLRLAELLEQLGDAEAVVVDDAEGAAEQPLLHLVNIMAERGGHLLLTAASPPAGWALRLADLRSRLLAGPAVGVEAPDDALLGAVLVKLFADRQLRISEDLIAYLLPRIERSFAAAQAMVAALDQAALADQRAVTVRLARDILSRERNPDRD